MIAVSLPLVSWNKEHAHEFEDDRIDDEAGDGKCERKNADGTEIMCSFCWASEGKRNDTHTEVEEECALQYTISIQTNQRKALLQSELMEVSEVVVDASNRFDEDEVCSGEGGAVQQAETEEEINCCEQSIVFGQVIIGWIDRS